MTLSLSKCHNKIMQGHVYICEARTSRYYVGITNDPEKRLSKHNGKGSKLAREQGPFKLLYVSEAFANKSSARKRDTQVKGWAREKEQKLISGVWK